MKRAPFWRTHWRLILLLAAGIVLLAYAFVAATLLPQWFVSLTAGKADPNTQLNAVTNTRNALLGILTPLVILIGGLAALLNYQEVRRQNIRTDDLTLLDRDETRRLRRAEVYAGLTSACQETWDASSFVFHADQDNVNSLYEAGREAHNYLWYVITRSEKSAAMNIAHDRVMLLGADSVQPSAANLVLNCHQIAAKALITPKVSDEEWRGITITEYNQLHRAFLDAARGDLAPTR